MSATARRKPQSEVKPARASNVLTRSLTRCFAYSTEILDDYLKDAYRRARENKHGRGSDNPTKETPKMIHQDLINEIARKHGLNPELVAAIIITESAFETEAVRYESRWSYHLEVDKYAKALNISYQTEFHLQKFSYGLMQVMGSVARECQYTGSLLKLCRPDLGVEYGCIHFAKYMRRYNDIKKSLSAYNGGPGAIKSDGTFSNEKYVSKVMTRYMGS